MSLQRKLVLLLKSFLDKQSAIIAMSICLIYLAGIGETISSGSKQTNKK